MQSMKRFTIGACALGFVGTVGLVPTLHAADHQEAPGAQAELAADIGDYYAWHDASTLNMVLTFGTLAAPGTPASYNSDILYTLHFDTTADNVSDVQVHARFAQDTDGAWGLQVTGIGDTPITGAVETEITAGAVSAYAGLKDDPFFFDLEGFNATVNTGTISFDPTRDSVAGLNVTSIVLQAPLSAVVGNATAFQTWATTGSL